MYYYVHHWIVALNLNNYSTFSPIPELEIKAYKTHIVRGYCIGVQFWKRIRTDKIEVKQKCKRSLLSFYKNLTMEFYNLIDEFNDPTLGTVFLSSKK